MTEPVYLANTAIAMWFLQLFKLLWSRPQWQSKNAKT